MSPSRTTNSCSDDPEVERKSIGVEMLDQQKEAEKEEEELHSVAYRKINMSPGDTNSGALGLWQKLGCNVCVS